MTVNSRLKTTPRRKRTCAKSDEQTSKKCLGIKMYFLNKRLKSSYELIKTDDLSTEWRKIICKKQKKKHLSYIFPFFFFSSFKL